MSKYLFKRILHGLISVVIVVAIVMVLVYSLTDRELIFANDPLYTKRVRNDREIYKYQQLEEFLYVDYVTYQEYLIDLTSQGDLDEATRVKAANIGRTAKDDSDLTKDYVAQFKAYYEGQGYTVKRLNAVMLGSRLAPGGTQQLFAYKDVPLFKRLVHFFTDIFHVDTVNYVEDDIEDRGLTFTLFDPVYNTESETGAQVKEVFSPAIIGNGTKNKYLLYFDDQFPYIHQNLVSVRLGTSFVVNQGVDVVETMTKAQGSYVKRDNVVYPTGFSESSADDLHSATYAFAGSREISKVFSDRYTDDYTNVTTYKQNKSKLGFSFVIGIISSILAYALSVPLGILMARKKDKLVDKIGTAYIVFILAVPSLAYIFMFKAIGAKAGLPATFDLLKENKAMYILPIVSLALPSVAGLMKWLRRYMIDQMNSDYVKFARSCGLSDGEVFSKHILKNAAIPIIHGIPGSVLGALVGAIITESVYKVPGAGGLLTEAINKHDNAVIVGLTLFYALLSITSIILGDILISMADPRISFNTKER